MQTKIKVEGARAAGCRLDSFLAKRLGIARNQLKSRRERLQVNGADAKLSHQVRDGDEIFLSLQDEIPLEVRGEDIPLNVIFEDSQVVALNKKQGMVVHPGAGNKTGTLANALVFHCEAQRANFSGENVRPGIVHRLDKDTSGVMICAKNVSALEFLQAQFRERKAKKQYIAIVKGVPCEKRGSVKNYIFRSSRDRKTFKCGDLPKGKFAWTDWQVLRVYGNYSVLRLNLHTGRTHQIRVHLKHLGLPILGDKIYGSRSEEFPRATLMLHAFKLKIRLPNSASPMTFKAKLPARFKKTIDFLEVHYGRSF